MTSNPPRLGERTVNYSTSCAWALEPGTPECGQPATRHVYVITETRDDSAVLVCDEHAPVARAVSEEHSEHPVNAACYLPAAYWWDSGCTPLRDE